MHSRYSHEFLSAREQELLKQKVATAEELGRIAWFDESSGTHIALQPDYDTGTVEDPADNSAETEVLQEREARVSDLEKSLAEINLALTKLKQGTYGRCEATGDWIDEDRLKVYPAARTCLPDQDS